MSTTSIKEEPLAYSRLPLTPDGQLKTGSRYVLRSPRDQVILSFIKKGKTDSMMGRSKFFIGDAEGGTDKFEGLNASDLTRFYGPNPYEVKNGIYYPAGLIETCRELNRANKMAEFNLAYEKFIVSRSEEDYKQIVELINRMPFPIFVIDTITFFMELIYDAALAEYNANLSVGPPKTDIRRVDNYGGVKYIRKKLIEVKSFIEKKAAPFIIYNGHAKMRKSVLSKADDELNTLDLDLEGQLAGIFTKKTEAIALFLRNDKGCFLDYTNKTADDDTNARPRHLGNRVIKISELHTYDIDTNGDQVLKERGQTYWERIYPEIRFN